MFGRLVHQRIERQSLLQASSDSSPHPCLFLYDSISFSAGTDGSLLIFDKYHCIFSSLDGSPWSCFQDSGKPLPKEKVLSVTADSFMVAGTQLIGCLSR